MPEYLSPGVFVEETSDGRRPIGGVRTDVAGFVGLADRGPTAPRAVSSWVEFEKVYGGLLEESYLAWAVRGFFLNGGHRCYVARVAVDGTPRLSDYVGDPQAEPDERTGLAALADIGEISLLAVPDEVCRDPEDLTPVTNEVTAQCERLGNRFALVSTLRGQHDPAALPPRPDSSYAAFYYPWIEVEDSRGGAGLLVPPSGHIAGIIARTDVERGVWKAPANEVIRGAVGLEFPVTDVMQKVLNPLRVNCLRDFRSSGRGIVVWGNRTLSPDPEWRYVNVRRFFLYLKRSIYEDTQWVVFEPNDEATWARVREAISNFLREQWRLGALMGPTPEDAFYVRCDSTTMTQDDIDSGRLICEIGIAPLRPAEFVIFRIVHSTADALS